MRVLTLFVTLMGLGSSTFAADAPSSKAEVEKGTVRFEPVGDQKEVPERYRLTPHRFDYEMNLKHHLPTTQISIHEVRFPSPVQSPHEENNTVHAEYYRPHGKGPFPGVIVLDISGGDQSLSRSMSLHFAQKGIGALFVQMAYYGPRRPQGSNLRMLSTNIGHSLDAVRQTVLDLRRATAWLESRPELDPRRLGISGTSLGSFMAALTAEMEPKLGRVAILLGGGGLVDAYYNHPRAALIRLAYEKLGGTKEEVAKLIAPVDPLTCAAHLKNRQVLMIAAKRDEIVPPKMATALWEASGKQKIVWYDCTHTGAALYMISAMKHLVQHFSTP